MTTYTLSPSEMKKLVMFYKQRVKEGKHQSSFFITFSSESGIGQSITIRQEQKEENITDYEIW